MDDNAALQALNELIPYLEAMDTKTMAILQALQQIDLLTEKQFAPHLEQAANAANIKWLAVRVRIERLLAARTEPSGQNANSSKANTMEVAADEKPDQADKKSETTAKTATNREASGKDIEGDGEKRSGSGESTNQKDGEKNRVEPGTDSSRSDN